MNSKVQLTLAQIRIGETKKLDLIPSISILTNIKFRNSINLGSNPNWRNWDFGLNSQNDEEVQY